MGGQEEIEKIGEMFGASPAAFRLSCGCTISPTGATKPDKTAHCSNRKGTANACRSGADHHTGWRAARWHVPGTDRILAVRAGHRCLLLPARHGWQLLQFVAIRH